MCDYIGHGVTAITHAADDRSVIESLEGLSHIYRSAEALAEERDYRLGLVAIGMRSNPYGFGVMENSLQNRIAMAGAGPQAARPLCSRVGSWRGRCHRGHKVSSLALSALVGPFGAIHRRKPGRSLAIGRQGRDGIPHLSCPPVHVPNGRCAKIAYAIGRERDCGCSFAGPFKHSPHNCESWDGRFPVRLPHDAEIRS
jgi:hypothetical protein